jgi:hypothetical protein
VSGEEPEEASPRPAAVGDEAEQEALPEPAGDGGAAPRDKPARKLKKKRRRPEPEPRPGFARGFPADPGLDALVVAFEEGDSARVRREAPALAKRTDRADVRRAARELRKRVDPDPIAVYLLVGASLLLAFLAVWYWTHPHEAP